MDRGRDGGGGNDLPWASVFDPAANARAFSAIQAEGFRAASELVDRFARIARTGRNGLDRSAPAAPLTNEQRAEFLGATDIEPLIRSWWAMMGQFLLGSGGAPDPVVTDDAILDFSGPASNGRLDLEATVPGDATTEVWLHNKGPTDFGEIEMRCSDLLAHHGGLVRSAAVTLTPAVVVMPSRSSRGIDMKIEVPHDIQPGIYRGTLLVDGHQELWLPVALTVRSSVS